MKVQMLLCAGALAGMSMIGAAVMSQTSEPPSRPGTSPPTQLPPSRPTTGAGGQAQALQPLLGTWEVQVKTFEAGGAGATGNVIAQGTSTRSWLFGDGKVLQEEVRCNPMRTSQVEDDTQGVNLAALQETPPRPTPPSTPPSTPPPQPRPGTTPPPRDITPPATPPVGRMNESFQGHGMFGYNSENQKFQHVWCDSTTSKLCMSTGTYDESSKTITFMVQDAASSPMPSRPAPSTTPPTTPRPGTPPTTPDDDEDKDNKKPGGPNPQATTPRTGQPGASGMPDLSNIQKVVVKMTAPDRHVIEYYKSGGTKVMEVAYTKQGASRTTN